MKVRVTLLLTFADKAPDGTNPFELDMPEGSTVARVLLKLHIDESSPKVLTVNGRAARPDRELADGDSITIFPAVAGG